MKKIFILNGSRKRNGKTEYFINSILSKLPDNTFQFIFRNPQDYKMLRCTGCGFCFKNTYCVLEDDLEELQNDILSSDVFIIASPVYLHYMTGEMKAILDRLSWWSHTFRLQGKPTVVLSTCASNGHNTVIEPLKSIISLMGGNVIASANAAQIPNQIYNNNWLVETSTDISKKILKYSNLPPQSNEYLDKLFPVYKSIMLAQEEHSKEAGDKSYESEYWRKTGMLDFDLFSDYLLNLEI